MCHHTILKCSGDHSELSPRQVRVHVRGASPQNRYRGYIRSAQTVARVRVFLPQSNDVSLGIGKVPISGASVRTTHAAVPSCCMNHVYVNCVAIEPCDALQESQEYHGHTSDALKKKQSGRMSTGRPSSLPGVYASGLATPCTRPDEQHAHVPAVMELRCRPNICTNLENNATRMRVV